MIRAGRAAKAVLTRRREEAHERFRAQLAMRGKLAQWDSENDLKALMKIVYPDDCAPAPLWWKK